MNPGCRQVYAVLLRYLPSALTDSQLQRALAACGLTAASYHHAYIEDLISKLESGIRLFVEPKHHAELLRELRAVVSQKVAPRTDSVALRTERDVSHARLLMKRICADLEASAIHTQKCVTIVSELARNIVSYTPGGSIEISSTPKPRRILLRATDTGKGISGLDEILAGQYQSKTGLGRGIFGVKRLANRFDISTGANGTDVRVEVVL
jgi:serine/threonine-protein kinase RsbT